MSDGEAVVEELGLGLDRLAEHTYRLMLGEPEITVDQVAVRTGADPAEIRAAMDRLAALSLLRAPADGGDPTLVVDPEYGLEALLAGQQAELLEHQHRIERNRAAATALIAKFAHLHVPRTHPDVEHLGDLEAVRARLAEVTAKVGHELLAFCPGGAQTEDNLEASKPLDAALLERGVRIRTLYVDSVRHHAPSVAYATWLNARGGQTRTVAALPLRMIIADRELALVPVNPECSAEGAVLMRGPGTVAALCALFDHLWTTGTPLIEALPGAGTDLGRQEREVLRLLAQGLTDEAVAVRLGVSLRTTRRVTAKLMDRLGARSRFQAGMRAVELGWL
ncbi:LuxR C-terminal-related transcriptional regulator [Streptomyces sp. NPDC048330]|uniref:LuxR C-terminal-related transcriptional regulator n=1 Tax=Streptomyces sp. NPDC048330 TaxID=3365533 RepID=UPI00371A7D6C